MLKTVTFAVAALVLHLLPVSAQDAPTSDSLALALSPVLERAAVLNPLKAVIVAHKGQILAERGYRGNTLTAPTNIKSASKVIISALVGIAIEKDFLEGADQKIAPILSNAVPSDPDPRIERITIGHLLSMQAGLRRIILRIGINLGDVIGEGSDIYGDGVNIAARLETLAEPGGICISAKVHEEVRGKIGGPP